MSAWYMYLVFCFPQDIEAACAKEIPQVWNGRDCFTQFSWTQAKLDFIMWIYEIQLLVYNLVSCILY